MSDEERLTKRDRKGRAYFDDDGSLIRGASGSFRQKKDMTARFIHQRLVALDKTIDRLAAYEDTGLEPEEIEKILERGTPLEGGTAELMKEYLLLGSIDHLRELVQAEKDGRLVVLPSAVNVNMLRAIITASNALDFYPSIDPDTTFIYKQILYTFRDILGNAFEEAEVALSGQGGNTDG